jgi:molybdopterin molybdotransferase
VANLLSVSEARTRILNQFQSLDPEEVRLEDSQDRVLFEGVVSGVELPPFSNSGMDGFAVRAAEIQQATPDVPVRLRVTMDIPAGKPASASLKPGEAARIMTGAMLPEGADCVVPLENTDRSDQQPLTLGQAVTIFRSVNAGEFIRPKGQDLAIGEIVMLRGRKIQPQDIGLLATLGRVMVKVFRHPRVAVLSSGDEILPPEQPLTPGKIHDSNTYTISALVKQAGGTAFNLGIAPDNLEMVRARLDQAVAKSVDLILTSAGVSVGAFDFIRTLVESEGQLDFWRVNMRPGKPVAFGRYKGVPLIGLPGNPVSAFVGFEVFVRPAIGKLGGLENLEHPIIRVRLGEPVESDGRESYLRIFLKNENGTRVAYLAGHQGSGNLFSLVLANALLIVPSGVKSLAIETELDAWLLNNC